MLAKSRIKIDRTRKVIKVWGDTHRRIQEMSQETGIPHVELVHEAVYEFEKKLRKSLRNQVSANNEND